MLVPGQEQVPEQVPEQEPERGLGQEQEQEQERPALEKEQPVQGKA